MVVNVPDVTMHEEHSKRRDIHTGSMMCIPLFEQVHRCHFQLLSTDCLPAADRHRRSQSRARAEKCSIERF